MCDFDDAKRSCEFLGIKYTTIDISNSYNSILDSITPFLKQNNYSLGSVTTINTAPRIRMTTLYALAGSLDYLVANTSNLSEASVGYTTKWGDNVGDFAPIANFTKTEVCEIGLALGLPKEYVLKAPTDGLSGKEDEEKIGFSYSVLDEFIRTGKSLQSEEKIKTMSRVTAHKRALPPKCDSEKKNFLK